MYTIVEKLQDISQNHGKIILLHAMPLVDSDDLPDNPPRPPSIGQVEKLLKLYRAPVAQLVEHRAVMREVVSSTPAGPTLRVLK